MYPKILHYLQNKNKLTKQNEEKNKSSSINDKLAISRIESYQKTNNSNRFLYYRRHFHWGKSMKFNAMNYIGLPFFACKKKYFVVEYTNYCLSLMEKEF